MNRAALPVFLGLASSLSLVASNFRVGGPPFSSPSEPTHRYAVLDTGAHVVVKAMNNRGDFISANKRWINGAYQDLEGDGAGAADLAEDGTVVGSVQVESSDHDSGWRAALWPPDSTTPVILQTPGVNVTNSSGTFISHAAKAATIDGDFVYGNGVHLWDHIGLQVYMAETRLVWDLSESLSTPAIGYAGPIFQYPLGVWYGSFVDVRKARGGHTIEHRIEVPPWPMQNVDYSYRINGELVSYLPLDINKYGAHIVNTSTNGYVTNHSSTFLQQGTNRIPLPLWSGRMNARRETNQSGVLADFFQVVGGSFVAEPEFPGSTSYVNQNFTTDGSYTPLFFHAINDCGIIVATGLKQSSTPRTVLLVPIDISFEAVEGNTPIDDNKKAAFNAHGNPIADQWMPGKGRRIFPDRKTVDDTTARNEVYVKVTGVPQGWKVRLKAFDVDDPTPDSLDPDHVIDENDDSSTERGNDNNGYDGLGMQQPPYFESSGDVSEDCTVDANGVAKLVNGQMPKLVLTMQPGDNLRVAAILLKPDGAPFDGQSLDDLQVVDSRLDGYVPGDSDQQVSGFNGALSPMLTVWRRLWLEFDSMGSAPTTGDEKNFDEGVIDTYTDNGNGTSTLKLNIRLTDEADRYEEGQIEINGAGTFTVISNTDNLISDDDVVVQGTPGNIVVGKSFKIYDDDHQNIGSRTPRTMPYALTGGGLIFTAFADAYILPVDVPAEYKQNNVLFNRNLELGLTSYYTDWLPTVIDKRDLNTEATFWTAYCLAAYQGPASADEDPYDHGTGTIGQTDPSPVGLNLSAIYVETLRELETTPQTPRITEIHTVVHEIGHQGGGKHTDGQIMAEGAPTDKIIFAPITIRRFRVNEIYTQND